MRRLVPSSLTGRLVATLVLVVLVISVVVATVTSLAVRHQLNGQREDQVESALQRSEFRNRNGNGNQGLPPGGSTPPQGDPRRGGPGLGDAPGTLNATFDDDQRFGFVVQSTGEQRVAARRLSSTALRTLAKVPADGDAHHLDLPGYGPFVVKVSDEGSARLVAGMSTRDVNEAVRTIVLWTVVLALAAVLAAVLAGRLLIRRQLRPLRAVAATAHEVSAMPLSTGEIGQTVRVPEALTDERSEVGSVGSALNTMLAHVEHALDERHRSELQVRQFLADASHELRTPLTTIHGYAELSRRTGQDGEQLASAMTKVEAEANRMSRLVEDMLLLARLDAGRPLARDEVDLTKLVLEAIGDARVVGPEHRWQLDLPDDPVVVTGDEQRLHQVVTNLLNNARRHTPPGTAVTVSVQATDADVVLGVEDDGPGLTPDLAASAFERFSRGDSSRTRASGGAGLGLSLVQAITAAHGGSVSVASRPGRTRFEVRLPGALALTAG